MNSATSSFFMVPSIGSSVSPLKANAISYPLIFRAALEESHSRIDVAQLIRLAEISYGRRDYVTLEQITQSLIASSYGQDAGLYYLAQLEQIAGRIESSRSILEPLTRYASPLIRPRAKWALAAIHHQQGEVREAASSYLEAARAAKDTDPRTICGVFFQLSLLRSQAGDHRGAIEYLEAAWPIVQLINRRYPHVFYIFHNDLACELAEVGKLDEARKHSSIACSFSFAESYPEWKATERDIEEKAQAAIRKTCVIVIHRPEPEPKPARSAIPLALACFRFNVLSVQDIILSGALYLSRAPASVFQHERIRFSIRRRGPPQSLLSL